MVPGAAAAPSHPWGSTSSLSPLAHPTQPSSAPFWEKLWRNLQRSSSSGMGGYPIGQLTRFMRSINGALWRQPRNGLSSAPGPSSAEMQDCRAMATKGERCQLLPSCLGVISTLLPLRIDDENQFPNLRVCCVFSPKWNSCFPASLSSLMKQKERQEALLGGGGLERARTLPWRGEKPMTRAAAPTGRRGERAGPKGKRGHGQGV